MNKKQGWIGDPQIKDIRTTKAESETRLTKMQESLPGLMGYGITRGSGEKISIICEELTPEIQNIFREGIRGHDVRFLEVGHIVALNVDRKDKIAPLVGGISTGHYKISAGTLGSIVYDNDTNEPLLLSNCHVFANSDTPEDEYALQGDSVHQPGLYDDRNAAQIGELRSWVPIENNITIDAALVVPYTDISNTILDIPKITGTTSPKIDTHVRKSGRTTGYTEGKIISIESTVEVDYGFATIRFTDQFITTRMSEGGDSGSICVTDNNEVVGLLFAGSDKVTVYNDINNVIDLLNIKFVPYDTTGSDTIPPSTWPSANDAIIIAAIIAALTLTYTCIK